MGEAMKLSVVTRSLLALLSLVSVGQLLHDTAMAQDHTRRNKGPEAIYLELTRDFYEALRNEGDRPATVYTNDPAAVHLREIAVSTRFMVQTNLEILKQQEIMIQLLRRLIEKQ